MARIPPSEQLAERVEQLRRETDVEDLANELVRLGAKKLIQELLEAEVPEALGRGPYERRAGGAQGYRNGYKRRRLDTAERRGLRVPLTVTTDGAPGLIKAVEAIWPEAERIRCWVHKMRNVLDKVPDGERAVVKAHLEAVRDAPDYETGKRLAEMVLQRFERTYPSAMRSFAEDLEASLAHLKLPPAHRRSVRTTNLAERSFEEERRRAKVMPRFRTEKECLKLVFGTLWRASKRWRRVRFSKHERKQLERYLQERQIQRKEAMTSATVA